MSPSAYWVRPGRLKSSLKDIFLPLWCSRPSLQCVSHARTFDNSAFTFGSPLFLECRTAQANGIQIYLHQKKPSTLTTSTSENQQYTGNSISTGSVTTTPQVKRPIRVLKLQPQQQPLSQQSVTTSTLQPLRVSPNLPTNSGPYLAPLAAAPTRDTQIVYEVNCFPNRESGPFW